MVKIERFVYDLDCCPFKYNKNPTMNPTIAGIAGKSNLPIIFSQITYKIADNTPARSDQKISFVILFILLLMAKFPTLASKMILERMLS